MDSVHCFAGETDYHSYLPVTDLAELLERQSQNTATFLTYYRLGKLTSRYTFSEFWEASHRLAGRLQEEARITQGARCVLLMSNSPEILLSYAALFLLGAVAVPLNPAETPEFVETIITRTNASAVLLENREIQFPAYSKPAYAVSELLRHGAKAPPSKPLLKKEDPAAIFFTSGTTGTSKGAVLSHGNLLINSVATQKLHQMSPGTKHLAVLPLFHVNAFSFSFLSSLLAGSELVLSRTFFQPTFWNLVKAEGVHTVSLVPSIIDLLDRDRSARTTQGDLPNLRYVVTAAAPLKQSLLRSFYSRFGIRVIQAYGLSETVNFSLTLPTNLSEKEYQAYMLDQAIPPAGIPVWGNEMAILDPVTGNLQPSGTKGEIVIRGWNVMQGYFADKEATAQAFADGWFHTGDLGHYEELRPGEKFFFITGRVKEIIKRAGELIALAEIDRTVQLIQGLENAVAVGFPHRSTGEEIGLFVVRNENTPDEAEILRLARMKLPAFKTPKVIIFGEEIPRTPTGKIKRHLLKSLFDDYEATSFDLR